ncbi:MAG TPA: DUF799 family lipoprotein [Smithellaceae bacterium]|nr:DUF799 family lipoprotein [Smithellaceae bacterium]
MKIANSKLIVSVIAFTLLISCSSRDELLVKPDEKKKTIQNIVVLPVINKTADNKASQLLRIKLLEQLYFKGYEKISFETIDRKLENFYSLTGKNESGVIAPQVIKEIIGADGALYCKLIEAKTSRTVFYAPVTVSVSCELRGTVAGEVLWAASHQATTRNFHPTKSGLEIKVREAFEQLIEDVVNKIMETMPEGPKYQG